MGLTYLIESGGKEIRQRNFESDSKYNKNILPLNTTGESKRFL
jgi:hypothetical protein